MPESPYQELPDKDAPATERDLETARLIEGEIAQALAAKAKRVEQDTDPAIAALGRAVHGWTSGSGGATRDLPRYPQSAVDAPSGDIHPGTKFHIHDPEQDGIKANARVQKWADVAMWQAPKHTDPQKPKVTVSMCTPDPLGVMAMVNAQYTGRNLTSPNDATDAERREAWEAATVSQLSTTPLEWVQWSINFENVSRAFTHQLVRTRMAGYAQESMRFGVKDNVSDEVKLPPSLAGTKSVCELVDELVEASLITDGMPHEAVDEVIERNSSREQRWRNRWDTALSAVADAYAKNVDEGMPAEDARGLLPTNVLTRIHMHVDMKTLLGLAGMRLCTQAQFEWRAVFAELANAIREYGANQWAGERWQFDLIAGSFRPVCYAAGKCTMKAKSDRFCSIRARVDANEEVGRPSEDWNRSWLSNQGRDTVATAAQGVGRGDDDKPVKINAIHPAEWLLDPTAARVAQNG